ncbi:MAG: amidase family protein, partial [Gemmatimonadales bacterium]
MNRRLFVGSVAATAAFGSRRGTAAPRAEQRPGTFPLAEVPISQLQEMMTSGRTTSRRLVDQYAARIAALDQRGPRLGHVLQLNPDARAIADRMDAERRAGRVRGPLHGIPVLIKDNIATLDQMETTAGSLALLGVRPPKDSTVAQRLREAGAVILGKTNLSEWANFRSSRSTSGWSARGGQTHNPYATDRTPSGSSSGSAVAASASSCAVAVGTETSGSIVSPSSACGCVGIKPTVGLVSRAGIIPISHSQDTAGPIARTVADAAALLTVLSGADPMDEATAEAGQHAIDLARALDSDGLRGARIGVLRPAATAGAGNIDARILALYEAAIAVLGQRGADLVDPVTITVQLQNGGDLLQYEFKADIERYLAEWAPSASVHNLGDLIAFNQREAAREL